jgi:tetratricopeptide (TPR) repeat protein
VGSDELATHRTALRVRLANTLGALGQHQRAFMTLAAVATEHPAEVISVDSLDQLDEWAAHADMEDELDALFDDVIDEEMPDDSLRLVAQRAGLHHVAKNQAMRAIRFFRIVLDVQPDNEMAYGNLSRLYEDEQNWADLVRLIERKIAATDEDDERERLQNQLADAVEKELASEDAIETYAELVKSHPDNPIYADRLVRAHLLRDQHAEAYGLLNRFVDSALNDDQTVNIHLRLAEIAANHLHAPEEALVHYQDALAVKSDPRALMGVANLKYEAGDWAGVVTTIDALMAHNDALHFEERIAWLEKGIAAAERTQDDDAMQRFIAGMNQFDV